MQLSELHTFLAIVDTGSLVRASQKLNVTQSTVTARLKSLESELGQSLVNRQKSGATLTAAGVRLHRYATTMTELWKQATQETSLPDALSSVCNIGCHPDLWNALGEIFFETIRTNYPQVALSVSLGSQNDMGSWLSDGLVDIALTYSPSASQRQSSIPYATDQLILVSTLEDGPIRFDPGYVFVEAGEEFGLQHAAAYSDAGTARLNFGTAQLGLDHLLKNGGSAYLPERFALPHIEAGRLFALKDGPVFERSSFLIANKSALRTWPWFEECLNRVRPLD